MSKTTVLLTSSLILITIILTSALTMTLDLLCDSIFSFNIFLDPSFNFVSSVDIVVFLTVIKPSFTCLGIAVRDIVSHQFCFFVSSCECFSFDLPMCIPQISTATMKNTASSHQFLNLLSYPNVFCVVWCIHTKQSHSLTAFHCVLLVSLNLDPPGVQ